MVQDNLQRLFPRLPSASSTDGTPTSTRIARHNAQFDFQIAPEKLDRELEAAVMIRGSVPMMREVVERITKCATSGGVKLQDLVDLIHQDPVLVCRLIAMANRVAYQRGAPAVTIAEAVRRLGTRRLIETISDLGKTASREDIQTKNPCFSHALARARVEREIALQLCSDASESKLETDRVVVPLCLWQLPLLGLAWSFPSLYATSLLETDVLRSRRSDSGLEVCAGASRAALVQSAMQTLLLPDELKRFLGYASLGALKGGGASSPEALELREIAGYCLASSALVEEYLRCSGRHAFDELIKEWQTRLSLPGGSILVLLGKLADHLAALPEPPHAVRMPDAELFSRAAEVAVDGGSKVEQKEEAGADDPDDRSTLVAILVRQMTKARDSKLSGSDLAIGYRVWLTLYGLQHALRFDRVALLVVDYAAATLRSGVWLGKAPSELSSYEHSVSSSGKRPSIELAACAQGKALFAGRAIGADASQPCAFPILDDGKVQAVFYAERVGSNALLPLSLAQKMAVVALAECWQEGKGKA